MFNHYMALRAIKNSKRSSIMKHKTGAVLCNAHTRDNPDFTRGFGFVDGFSHTSDFRMADEHYRYSIHAELAALINCQINPRIAYVATVTRAGYLTSGLPCPRCAVLLYEAGVTDVFYTVRPREGFKVRAHELNAGNVMAWYGHARFDAGKFSTPTLVVSRFIR